MYHALMRYWSLKEVTELLRYYRLRRNSELRMTVLCRRLKRSQASVIGKAMALGVTQMARPRLWCRGDRNPHWKGDAAGDNSKRERAQHLFALGPCERCGEPGVERHHKDGDPGNNKRRNVKIVCRRCHMAIDGRLERATASLVARSQIFQPLKPCVNCKRPFKPLRRGKCHACYDYFHRVGKERPKGGAQWRRKESRGYRLDYSNPRRKRGRGRPRHSA